MSRVIECPVCDGGRVTPDGVCKTCRGKGCIKVEQTKLLFEGEEKRNGQRADMDKGRNDIFAK